MPPEQPTHEPSVAPALLPCPVCGQLTDSLKQYRFVKWFIIQLALVIGRGLGDRSRSPIEPVIVFGERLGNETVVGRVLHC